MSKPKIESIIPIERVASRIYLIRGTGDAGIEVARTTAPEQLAFAVECSFAVTGGLLRPGGVTFPSRAGASGSHHLPWALTRILPTRPKIKRLVGEGDWHAGRGCDFVC